MNRPSPTPALRAHSDPARARARFGDRKAWFILIAIAVLAVGARFVRLGEEDFWQDELHSLYNSAGTRYEVERLPYGVILTDLPRYADLNESSSVGQVWRTMRHDSHPPIYFVLLFLWRRLVGDGEAAVRTLPVIFSLLSLFAVALTLREQRISKVGERDRAYGDSLAAGSAVAFVLALSFSHVFIAQENRPYSLTFLLVSMSFWFVARIETRYESWPPGRRRVEAVAYALVILLAMLTHYFAGLALLGQIAWCLQRFRKGRLRLWLAALGGAAAIYSVVWLPTMLAQRDFIASQTWLIEEQPDHAQRTVLRLADLPIRLLFAHPRFRRSEVNSLLGVGLILAAGVVVWIRRKRDALLWIYWYAAPVLALAFVDFATGKQMLTHLRYCSIAVGGLAGFLAIAAISLPCGFRLAALVGFLVAVEGTLQAPAAENPHSRQAAGLLANELRSDDLLIYDATGWPRFWALPMFQTVSYYLPTSPHTLLLRDPPDEGLVRKIAEYDRFYVISPRIDGIPNPTPQTHPFVRMSDHFFDIGWVYAMSREKSSP